MRKLNIEGKRFNKCAYVGGDRNCSLWLPELMPKLLVLDRDRRQQECSLDSAPDRKIEWNKIKTRNQGTKLGTATKESSNQTRRQGKPRSYLLLSCSARGFGLLFLGLLGKRATPALQKARLSYEYFTSKPGRDPELSPSLSSRSKTTNAGQGMN